MPHSPFPREVAIEFSDNSTAIFVGRRPFPIHFIDFGGGPRARFSLSATAIPTGDIIGGYVTTPLSPFSREMSIAFRENATTSFVGTRLVGGVTAPISPFMAPEFQENATAIAVGNRICAFASNPPTRFPWEISQSTAIVVWSSLIGYVMAPPVPFPRKLSPTVYQLDKALLHHQFIEQRASPTEIEGAFSLNATEIARRSGLSGYVTKPPGISTTKIAIAFLPSPSKSSAATN